MKKLNFIAVNKQILSIFKFIMIQNIICFKRKIMKNNSFVRGLMMY
jgi:hypothetical protein